jgi:hypothetical protein
MINLNDTNGASALTFDIAKKCLLEFKEKLIGCEMGIAFGGGVEAIGKLWKERGKIYGMDTFEGHPLEITEQCQYTQEAGGRASLASYCMQNWYDIYGIEKVNIEYIQSELDKQGLSNVNLVKGLIDEKTVLKFKKLHYCLIDLDFPLSMWNGYNLVKDLIIKDGYLCLHDVVPKGHIHGNWEYYQNILKEGKFRLISEHPESYLAILKKN